MGNAHVAVVDDKEAIYYNYANMHKSIDLETLKSPQQGYYLETSSICD